MTHYDALVFGNDSALCFLFPQRSSAIFADIARWQPFVQDRLRHRLCSRHQKLKRAQKNWNSACRSC